MSNDTDIHDERGPPALGSGSLAAAPQKFLPTYEELTERVKSLSTRCTALEEKFVEMRGRWERRTKYCEALEAVIAEHNKRCEEICCNPTLSLGHDMSELSKLGKLSESDKPWPPRFHMAEMTPATAAKFLRDLCEQTVRGSKDWDNMQAIFEQFITDAYKAGASQAEGETGWIEPMHVIGLSGGKDSTCLALALAEREPRDYEYVCTPTGNELPELFDHLDALELRLGKPIKRLGIGKSLFDLCRDMEMLPNFRARWCTRMLKIEPTIEYVQSLPPGSVLYVGLRADEEERRGIYGEDIAIDFPLRRWGWGLNDVWRFLMERSVTIPRRTDCAQCFYQRIGEWWNTWKDHPTEFAAGVAIEQEIGHTFRTPGRDTWPVALADLGAEFARGAIPEGASSNNELFPESYQECRVCSL